MSRCAGNKSPSARQENLASDCYRPLTNIRQSSLILVGVKAGFNLSLLTEILQLKDCAAFGEMASGVGSLVALVQKQTRPKRKPSNKIIKNKRISWYNRHPKVPRLSRRLTENKKLLILERLLFITCLGLVSSKFSFTEHWKALWLWKKCSVGAEGGAYCVAAAIAPPVTCALNLTPS